jgi:hypothetical protein
VLLRVGISALAIVACGWFALGARQARDIADAKAIVSSASPLSKTQAARADSLLSDAGTLNPDSEVDLLRGQLALDEGNVARARKLFAGVTRQEPDNVEGWLWLADASAHDPVSFYVAEVRVRVLAPPVGPHR